MVNRTRRASYVLSFLLAALLTGACQQEEASDNTVGDQCMRIYSALCSRALNSCNYTGQLSECTDPLVAQCCTDKCDQPAIKDQDDDVDRCVDALANRPCADIMKPLPKPACDVLQPK